MYYNKMKLTLFQMIKNPNYLSMKYCKFSSKKYILNLLWFTFWRGCNYTCKDIRYFNPVINSIFRQVVSFSIEIKSLYLRITYTYIGNVTDYDICQIYIYNSPLADLLRNISPFPIMGYAFGPGIDHVHNNWRKMLCFCST